MVMKMVLLNLVYEDLYEVRKAKTRVSRVLMSLVAESREKLEGCNDGCSDVAGKSGSETF